MTDATQEARARAQEAERQGDVDGALHIYAEAGLLSEAVRMLLLHKRALDAGELIVSSVTQRPQPLQDHERAWAMKAAEIFISSAALTRAAEVYAWMDAREAGLTLVERLLDAGHVLEAGACLIRLGEHRRGVEVLMRVPRDSSRYVQACLEAARALALGAPLSMEIDRWLAEFIRRGPTCEAEGEGLYAIAHAFTRDGFSENAIECLRRIDQRLPGFRDAGALASRIESGARNALDDFARVLEEDARFRRHTTQSGRALDDVAPSASASVLAAPSTTPAPHGAAEGAAPTAAVAPSAAPSGGSGASAAPRGPPPTPPPAPSQAPSPAPSRAPSPSPLEPRIAPDNDSQIYRPDAFKAGVVVARRYRIDDQVGQGGMSMVFRATDMELHHIVALKVFTQPANDEALARFKQEVLLTRHVHHPNVVRVYDLGSAYGARFITMEFLVGEDLHAKMSRGLSLPDGVDLLIQACAGLEAAHQAGIVHRDIKPENLFVTRDGVLKVTDFGVAKHNERHQGLTIAGMVVGTPEYMAPEQAHGHKAVTARADIYSLGIILYFMCAGVLPFMHPETVPLLLMQVNQLPEPPRKRNPALPREMEDLVLQLLDKDPRRRPPSARALGERLADLRKRRVI